MKLAEVQRLLKAEVLIDAGKLDREVEMAFCADLISDVLVMCRDQTLLLTGMTHVQIIKTAEICDLAAVVFVRGKRPGPEAVALAEQKGIPLLLSCLTMYESAGLLFCAGLPGINRNSELHMRIDNGQTDRS